MNRKLPRALHLSHRSSLFVLQVLQPKIFSMILLSLIFNFFCTQAFFPECSLKHSTRNYQHRVCPLLRDILSFSDPFIPSSSSSSSSCGKREDLQRIGGNRRSSVLRFSLRLRHHRKPETLKASTHHPTTPPYNRTPSQTFTGSWELVERRRQVNV